MRIIVFIKQVLDNTKLKFADGKPQPDGVPMMMNPFDEYALETALRLKERAGGEAADARVTVMTLGAASAREMMKKALAAGADDAFLLIDPAYDTADSTAIAYALAAAVKQLAPDFKLLVFGQMALDDVAAQTGPKVAAILDLPSLTFGKNAALSGETLTLTRDSERGTEQHEMTLPGVISMAKCEYELRSSNIKGVMKANKTEIPVHAPSEFALEGAAVTPAMSGTVVAKTWERPPKSGGRVISGAEPAAAVSQLLDYLREAKVL